MRLATNLLTYQKASSALRQWVSSWVNSQSYSTTIKSRCSRSSNVSQRTRPSREKSKDTGSARLTWMKMTLMNILKLSPCRSLPVVRSRMGLSWCKVYLRGPISPIKRQRVGSLATSKAWRKGSFSKWTRDDQFCAVVGTEDIANNFVVTKLQRDVFKL